jgi:hypothetical protein
MGGQVCHPSRLLVGPGLQFAGAVPERSIRRRSRHFSPASSISIEFALGWAATASSRPERNRNRRVSAR